MEIFQIICLGIIATLIATILKNYRPEISLQVAIIAGVIIFSLMISRLSSVFDLLNNIATRANIDYIYFSIILKVIGIAYITEFASEICKDAGQGTIALKLEFAGKVLIIVLAAPIIYALMDLIIRILP